MRTVTVTHEIQPYKDGSGSKYALQVERTEKQAANGQPAGAEWLIALQGIGDARIEFTTLAEWREFRDAVEAAIEQTVIRQQ